MLHIQNVADVTPLTLSHVSLPKFITGPKLGQPGAETRRQSFSPSIRAVAPPKPHRDFGWVTAVSALLATYIN